MRMKKIIFRIILVSTVCWVGLLSFIMADTLEKLLPSSSGKWIQKGEDRRYDRESLYDYIDGGAELFNSYGLVSVISRTYVMAGEPEITVDIFDMKSADNAFGVFCHIRDGADTTFGQGSQLYDEAVQFWKGRFYVSITARDITPEVTRRVRLLAAAVDSAISVPGPLPVILDLLPEGVDRAGLIYFKHYVWQNSLYYFADENILDIGTECQAVTARVDREGKKLVCLIVVYPEEKQADSAVRNFADVFAAGQGRPAVAKIEDGTWLGCGAARNVLVAVFRAPAEKDVKMLIGEILSKI